MSDYIPASTVEELTDDDIMRFTQGTRKRFVQELIQDNFPQDPKEQHVMLTAMADMDRAALGNKRIGANERQAAADALVARAIGEISNQFGSTNPFAARNGEERELPEYEASRLPNADPVPGETDVGISDQTYKEMSDKFD